MLLLGLVCGLKTMCRLTRRATRRLMIDSQFTTHTRVESQRTTRKFLDLQLTTHKLLDSQVAGSYFSITNFLKFFVASVLLWINVNKSKLIFEKKLLHNQKTISHRSFANSYLLFFTQDKNRLVVWCVWHVSFFARTVEHVWYVSDFSP